MDNGQGSPGGHPEPDLFSTSPDYTEHSGQTQNEPQRVWKPERGAGQLFGAVLTLGCVVLAIISAQFATDAGGLGRLLWLLVALSAVCGSVLFAFLLVRLRSICYLLDDSALVITAAAMHIEIPYGEITDVVFRPRDIIDLRGYERLWPGFYDSLNATSEGIWRSIATTPPRERVRIHTARGGIVAISPERPVLFAEALDLVRRQSGRAGHARPIWPGVDGEPPPTPTGLPVMPTRATQPVERRAQRAAPEPARLPALPVPEAYRIFRGRIVHGDPVASRLLALSLLVLIVLLFMAAWKVDSVNQPLAVKWNPDGEPIWFVRPDGFWLIDGVWIYPVTAATIVVVNTALATLAAIFDRMLEARLLLSASVVVGFFMLLAMVRTTGLI